MLPRSSSPLARPLGPTPFPRFALPSFPIFLIPFHFTLDLGWAGISLFQDVDIISELTWSS